MSYSDLYLKSQSRPSRLMVFVAVVVMASAAVIYYTSGVKFTRASKQTTTKHHVVNLLPKQSGVFWEVQTADKGWVIYGENPSNLSEVAVDERDINTQKDRKHHYAVLKNLKPDTRYYYKLISNNELVSDIKGEPFSLRTLEEKTPGNALSPAYGTVVLPGGEPMSGVVVLISLANAVPLVATTGATGEWLVPLQYLVTKDTLRPATIDMNTILTINIFSEDGQSVVKATVAQASPLPQKVVIGRNYTFLEGDNVLSATSNKSKSSPQKYQVELRYPKQNAVIPGSAPLINGKGIPGESVTVSVDAKPVFTRRVRVDQYGDWLIQVKTPFRPGSYNLTFQTVNDRGQDVTIERSFTIIKSGEQVLAATATPSGSVTPRTTVTGSLTLTPTGKRSPTPEPTEIDENLTATPTPPPPVSGINMMPIFVTSIGLVIIGAGLFLAL